MTTSGGAGPTESELLLPWYAAGTLDRRAALEVKSALAHDAELRQQYEFVCEELIEAIRLNESLGATTARAGERLEAALLAESATAGRKTGK